MAVEQQVAIKELQTLTERINSTKGIPEDLKERLSAKKKPASVPKTKTLLEKLGFKSD